MIESYLKKLTGAFWSQASGLSDRQIRKMYPMTAEIEIPNGTIQTFLYWVDGGTAWYKVVRIRNK